MYLFSYHYFFVFFFSPPPPSRYFVLNGTRLGLFRTSRSHKVSATVDIGSDCRVDFPLTPISTGGRVVWPFTLFSEKEGNGGEFFFSCSPFLLVSLPSHSHDSQIIFLFSLFSFLFSLFSFLFFLPFFLFFLLLLFLFTTQIATFVRGGLRLAAYSQESARRWVHALRLGEEHL